VQQEIAAKAPLSSPALTGNPTAPTQTSSDSSTKLATTAFVQGLLANSGRMLAGSGVPSSGIGIDGDTYVRNDTPFAGSIYKKASGAWALAQLSTTWAARPSASSNSGAVITVSDWNADFFSDGTNWIPVGKRLVLTQSYDLNATRTTGTASSGQVFVTHSIPAGLVIGGCRYEVEFWANYAGTGTGGTLKSIIYDTATGTGGDYTRSSVALNTQTIGDRFYILVDDQSTNVSWVNPSGYTAGTLIGGGTSGMTLGTLDLNTAHSYRFRGYCPTDYSVRFTHSLVLHFR
jgi:hypothetical protein